MKWEIGCKNGILKPKYRISVCISSFKETDGEKKYEILLLCNFHWEETPLPQQSASSLCAGIGSSADS